MRRHVICIILIIALTLVVLPFQVQANCRGCCSRHGGVTCVDGITQCRDGSSLSSKCQSKGCNKCGGVSSGSSSRSFSPSAANPSKSSTIEKCVCGGKVIYTDVGCPCEPDEGESTKPASTVNNEISGFRCNGHVALGIPGQEEQLLCRDGYAVGYDYERKVPMWVAYRLTPDSVNKKVKRSNKFREDSEIPAQYRSTLQDYKGSGYDRGHMAASATVDFSYESTQESFLMSNMTPQLPGLNRQGWRILEAEIREWTNERGELYVVTGCLFEGPLTAIGDGVGVPSHFFKVVYDGGNRNAIAFLVPHRKISKAELSEFIVSVDEIERKTGMDFNRLLDDWLEDDMEDDVERMW